MNDDALRQLLRDADRTPDGEPPLTAEAILAAALRQRRRTAGGRAAATTLALGGVVLAGVMIAGRVGREALATGDATQLRGVPVANDARPAAASLRASPAELVRELASLEREARVHLTVAQALRPTGEDAFDASLAMDGGADLVSTETARSAALSWQHASLLEQQLQDLDAARREYQRVAARFPGTPWADLATTSLERLPAAENPPSL